MWPALRQVLLAENRPTMLPALRQVLLAENTIGVIYFAFATLDSYFVISDTLLSEVFTKSLSFFSV